MSKKLIRTDVPYEGLEITLWEVEGGYQVSVTTENLEGFDGEGVVFHTMEEAVELMETIPFLTANRDEMLRWIEVYENAELLPSIYDFESYEQVVQHILERHGEAGREVLGDPNQPPAMWHEWRHSFLGDGVILDHTHNGTSPAEVDRRLKKMLGIIQNPLFDELLKTDTMQEELVEANQELRRIYENNGIKFDE